MIKKIMIMFVLIVSQAQGARFLPVVDDDTGLSDSMTSFLEADCALCYGYSKVSIHVHFLHQILLQQEEHILRLGQSDRVNNYRDCRKFFLKTVNGLREALSAIFSKRSTLIDIRKFGVYSQRAVIYSKVVVANPLEQKFVDVLKVCENLCKALLDGAHHPRTWERCFMTTPALRIDENMKSYNLYIKGQQTLLNTFEKTLRRCASKEREFSDLRTVVEAAVVTESAM